MAGRNAVGGGSAANELQALSSRYQSQQSTLQSLVGARQALDSQLSENIQVQREFGKLKQGPQAGPEAATTEDQIYKLMGGVLMKQDLAEAKVNVEKRLEYIKGEIKRVEDQLKTTSEESEKTRIQIIEIQQKAQQAQAQEQS